MDDYDDIDGVSVEAMEKSFNKMKEYYDTDDMTIRDIYEAGWAHAHQHMREKG